MVKARHLPALLLGLLLVGCPPDTPTQPPSSGAGGGGQTTSESPPTPGPTTETGAPEAAAEEVWAVIPAPMQEAIYPMLQPAATWPAPSALAPVAEVPAERRPDPGKVRALEELVKFIVRPDLVPRDFEAALGVDAQGRTFVRLGKDKTQGSASLDVRRVPDDPKFDFPVFVMTIDDPAPGAQSFERLKRRVRNVVAPALAEELERRGDKFEPLPAVNGEAGVAGLAFLDRSGYGGQFPYLYAFGTEKHLLVLLQEVPHMSLDGKAPAPPPEERPR